MSRSPSRYPQEVNENVWYYENPATIQVYSDLGRRNGKPISFYIPLKMLRATLRRCTTPKKAKR